MAFHRVMILIWADLLGAYVMWIMQKYLTDVWKLGFTHAAGIMNVASGLPKVLPLLFCYFVDAGLPNKWMLLLSSIVYVFGSLLLFLSTPPILAKVTGTCKDYEPQCINDTKKALFYAALALIAVGISGHIVSLVEVFNDQFEKKRENNNKSTDELPQNQNNVSSIDGQISSDDLEVLKHKRLHEYAKKTGRTYNSFRTLRQSLPFQPRRQDNKRKQPSNEDGAADRSNSTDEDDLSRLQFQPVEAMLAVVNRQLESKFGACVLVFVPVVILFALPYIKPWTYRFGIPAIITLVATIAFLTGFNEYKGREGDDQLNNGSPVRTVLRVILAAALNMFKRRPSISELYGNSNADNDGEKKLSHTNTLRCLDKAAIEEGPKSRRWLLCTVNQVEETKRVLSILPLWIPLILSGLVTSIGSTYFVEQASHMNYKVGKLKLPDSLLLLLYEIGKSFSKRIYGACFKRSGKNQKYAPGFGMALATISATLCCIVAAAVETRRIRVIRDHDLVDKPDDDIPMTVFSLLPQYFLLGGLDTYYDNSVTTFFSCHSPPSMKKFLVFLSPGLSGLGIIGSVLSVYVVGRVSQRHGKPNWFQYDLNASRLDRYYWTLAALSAVSFIWLVSWAVWYPYWEPLSDDEETDQDQTGGADNNDDEEDGGVMDTAKDFVMDVIKENRKGSD
ncbi:OLC1v1004394C1 [Oldenlandia corymbosa var. corymbosa]|uniref:OLC1v1004394C1 n=1 Tax=Oldenlandia corymbosa var. corymbosa TaxID=529605 RepID=A0AAV1DDG3_OLDCO|nr:OLC1v1004394C1 [Oldenlandia corymbosa var. corymbosa]